MATRRHSPWWLCLGKIIGKVLPSFHSRCASWLLLKPGSLGDALLFTGALRELRRQYPDARLILVTSARAIAIFERCTHISDMLVINERTFHRIGLINRLKRIWFAARVLRGRHEGVIYPFYGDPSRWSHPFYPLLAAEAKIHFAGQYSSEIRFPENCTEVHVKRSMHEMDKMVSILQAAGCKRVKTRRDIWPDMGLKEEERVWARSLVNGYRLPVGEGDARSAGRGAESGERGGQEQATNDRPAISGNCTQRVLCVAVCAGARFKCKAWPEERYAELFKRITEPEFLTPRGYDHAVFFLLGGVEDVASNKRILELGAWSKEQGGGGKEQSCRATEPQHSGGEVHGTEAEAQPFCSPARDPVPVLPQSFSGPRAPGPELINLAGATTIHQAAAVIEACDLCIGNDTFGLHAAIAVGTPSVVIMWGGSGDQWIPWGDTRKHRMVRANIDCLNCGGNCTEPSYECMERIQVETVVGTLRNMLPEIY